jgi:hypothetical protein
MEKSCKNCFFVDKNQNCPTCKGSQYDGTCKYENWQPKVEVKHEDTYRSCRTCKDSEVISGITPRWKCKRNMDSLCGIYYKYWEPKGETKAEEKLYTTGQMIDMLSENRTRTAVSDNLSVGFISTDYSRLLCWMDSKEPMKLSIEHLAYKWLIIEPKPRKGDFAEAFKARMLRGESIKSVATNNTITSHHGNIFKVTEEEINSEWIIGEWTNPK